MSPNLNHEAIYISGSILTLVCLLAPLLFKKELKFVSERYYLVAYYISVIIFFLTITNPHEPATLSSEITKSIGAVNNVFLSFLLTAFICRRDKEQWLFAGLIGLTLVKVIFIYLHKETAYIAVLFSLLYNLIGLTAILKNIKTKADTGLAICFGIFTLLLAYTLFKAPLNISHIEFYDKYFVDLLVFIPAFISGSTIFIFLRYVIELNEKLVDLAHKDSLTGLLNRRFAFELMQKQSQYIARKQSSACVIMTDIDHFKSVNDNYGHPAGDEAIKAFANCILQQVRKYDVACRYGGEEFLLFLPDTDITTACNIAERIREQLKAIEIKEQNVSFGITASFGVANYDSDTGLEETINNADKALYQAKQTGRDKVLPYHD